MRRSVRSVLVAMAVSAGLAFLEVHRSLLTRIYEGSPLGFEGFWTRLVPMWLTMVVISPWCAFMAWRVPVRRGRLTRAVIAHLGGGAVFVALHLALLMTLHFVAARIHFGQRAILELPSGHRLMHTYVFYVGMELSAYATLVLVILLIEAHRTAAEREVAAARLAETATSARLETLQAQLRPHFLFNTLNALAVLARRGDGAAVDRAIGDLGELLRMSFDPARRQEIPLGEELDFLERYLALQRLRFPDRLEVAWAVEDEARRARVPALLVQPLVENALEHGLATGRGGHVRVAARRDGDALEVEVSDDGPGFGGPAGRDGGVGLAHTRERLALLHGGRATLTCSDRPGGGAIVRVRLPWRAAPREGVA